MSTNNIGFYENLTKIIFELSSNIVKYAPYFFCCHKVIPLKDASLLANSVDPDQTLVVLEQSDQGPTVCPDLSL